MMKNILRAIALMSLASLTFAWDATIAWTPPTFYVDGAPLLEQDLDYYTLYCDDEVRQIIDSVIGTNTAVVDFPNEVGQHRCVLTATSLAGIESGDSNEYVFTNQPTAPTAPVVVWE